MNYFMCKSFQRAEQRWVNKTVVFYTGKHHLVNYYLFSLMYKIKVLLFMNVVLKLALLTFNSDGKDM